MKSFLKFFSLAMLFAAIFTLTILTTNTTAMEIDVVNNVIYISDSGTGDGSSAANALGNETHPDYDGVRTYMNTALYQAAEKLSKTGGTIVICGNVTIGSAQCEPTSSSSISEFEFPKTDKTIRITSVYGEEDYTGSASFISADNSFINLNSPTLWENLNIVAAGNADRAICCNGYKTVFGNGLNCTYSDGKSSSHYLSIAGGSRYKALTSDTDVTIKSGKFRRVVGGIWTAASDKTNTLTGDTHIRIEGGSIYTMITGNSTYAATSNGVPSPLHDGDVYLTITGGSIDAQIFCVGVGGFKDTESNVYVSIEGGFFSSSRTTPILATYFENGVEKLTGNRPKAVYIDLSNSVNVTRTENLNRLITNLPENGQIVNYPAHWATSVTKVTAPSAKTVFTDDVIESRGGEVSVTYKNKHNNQTTYTDTVKYEDAKSVFKAVCDTTTAGSKTVSYQYGGIEYASENIQVIQAPKVTIKGAQIRINDAQQKVRFVAEHNNVLADGMTIKERGVIAVASDMLNNPEAFNHENTVAMFDYQPGETDIFKTEDGITTFSAITLHYIRQNNYCTDYTARAYIKVNYNGKDYYRYSDIIERNVYNIAKQAMVSGLEAKSTEEAMKTNVVDVYDNYNEFYPYNSSSHLRDRVLEYMETMANYAWQPKETFLVLNPSGSGHGSSITALFEKNKTYYGLPYVNDNLNQYETFIENFETTNGVNYFSNPNNKIIPLTGSYYIYDHDTYYLTDAQKDAAYQNYLNMPGNDCITAVLLSWNTVLNNREQIQAMNSTYSVIPGHDTGVIPVGDYEYSYEKHGYDTPSMVKATGTTRMFAAYAKLRKGDAMITLDTSTNVRHARLVVGVDTSKQIVTTLEQATTHITGRNNNYTTMTRKEYTFQQLFDTAYLPITIPELATGNSDSEFTYATDLDLANDLPNGEFNGKVISNRQIIYLRVTLKDSTGKEILNNKQFVPISGYSFHAREVELSDFNFLKNVNLTEGETYTLSLYVRTSGLKTLTSEVPAITNYQFTAK